MTAPLLLEIGVEELPPLSMRRLSDALCAGIANELAEAGLEPGTAMAFASPRRLGVLIDSVNPLQADRDEILRGPPLSVAYDESGNPTKALEAFVKKSGGRTEDLTRIETGKGEWVGLGKRISGANIESVVQEALVKVAAALPVDRRMRWGAGDYEFVRPVHWLLALHGDQVLDIALFSIKAGRETRGHRFHAPDAVSLNNANDYVGTLRAAFVVPALDERIALVKEAVDAAVADIGATTSADPALLEEIAAIVEWPKAVLGEFDPRFLELPREVLISTLKKHQRYFPVEDASGALLPRFVTVANLASKDPGAVALGNQRVVTPRLDDAAFFFESDLKRSLAENVERLQAIVYEKSLGSLGDKSNRVSELAVRIAKEVGVDSSVCERIAILARADLVTDMVAEFPDLQGTMGGYYAAAAGESGEVAAGVRDFYKPGSSGDTLPESLTACVVGIAERIDTLVGVFGAGKKPKGNKDPFGLRRAALGVARLIIERDLEIDLKSMIAQSVELQPLNDVDDALAETVFEFVTDRLLAYYQAKNKAVSTPVFDAVRAKGLGSLADFDARLTGVLAFAELDAAASLVAANKRIANVLRKAPVSGKMNSLGFEPENDAEARLHERLENLEPDVAAKVEGRDYVGALAALAELREPVDQYFDDVMVMADDPRLQQQRLAELSRLQSLFLSIADVAVMGR